jgi:hypothetical protein
VEHSSFISCLVCNGLYFFQNLVSCYPHGVIAHNATVWFSVSVKSSDLRILSTNNEIYVRSIATSYDTTQRSSIHRYEHKTTRCHVPVGSDYFEWRLKLTFNAILCPLLSIRRESILHGMSYPRESYGLLNTESERKVFLSMITAMLHTMRRNENVVRPGDRRVRTSFYKF